jgi:hypothetical protein
MFYGRKQLWRIESPVWQEDNYNHSKATYKDEGTALIGIVVQDRTNLNANDLILYKATIVGYTDNEKIDKG